MHSGLYFKTLSVVGADEATPLLSSSPHAQFSSRKPHRDKGISDEAVPIFPEPELVLLLVHRC